MGGRCLSRKLKGNMFSSCVTAAYVNGLKTTVLTEKQQEKVQVCENSLARRIVGLKRVYIKKRMDEVTVEVGVKESFKKKLVRSALKRANHVERMKDEKLAKRADAQEVERKR